MLLAQPLWAKICLNYLFVLLTMFMYLKLCLDAMPCVFIALYHLVYAFFLCFGFQVGCRSKSSGLGLYPYTQISIKGLDQFFYACLCFVCSFPCFILQIHACLLRPRPLPCYFLFSLCGYVLVSICGLLVCLVVSTPLLRLVWMQQCVRVHLHDVGLLTAYLSLLCLALHVRVSCVNLVCTL